NASQTPLPAGGTYTINKSITLPAGTAAGDYYLLFAADDGNAQAETDETNNVRAAAIHAAPPVTWVDWTSGTAGASGSASGVLNLGTSSVAVSYSGEIAFIQTNGGTNYWNPSAPYMSATVPNAPPTPDIIALSMASSKTLTFSQPISNLLFAVVSLN